MIKTVTSMRNANFKLGFSFLKTVYGLLYLILAKGRPYVIN